jgi:nitric oxide reductase NorQ protein
MTKTSLPLGTVVKVSKQNDKYLAVTPDGTDVTDQFENYQLRNAVNEGMALKSQEIAGGGVQWRKVPVSEYTEAAKVAAVTGDVDEDAHDKIVSFLKNASAVRPSSYKMNDLNWRFAVRTVLRGKNMMIVGPKGTGKTVLAFTLRDVLERPFFNIPLGSTQDPRSVLIGNVHFKAGEGTFVGLSEFVKAIQTPNAIVLLDEISRAHPDAWNILMPVLDYKQRFLRIDEAPDAPTIPVASGVTFIMTANIGAQYTATRTMDAALLDRAVLVEVEYLDRENELALLKERVQGVSDNLLNAITNTAIDIRKEAKSSDPRLAEGLSTRNTIEMAELVYDGFTFEEAAELVIYPQFSEAGGAESERAIVKQIVQKHIPMTSGSNKGPFNLDPNDDTLPWK